MDELKGLTPGRIVHFVGDNKEHMAALIVEVDNPIEGICCLRIFERYPANDGSKRVKYSAKFEENTWHWVERD
jgi:hypothetical protein